jgi:hypothetical protein
VLTEIVTDDDADSLEDPITEPVAMLRVDLREVIDVGEDQRERTCETFSAANFLFKRGQQHRARMQRRQRIVQRGLVRLAGDAFRDCGQDVERSAPHHLGDTEPSFRRGAERLVERELVERRALDDIDQPEQLPHGQTEIDSELPEVGNAARALVEFAFTDGRR